MNQTKTNNPLNMLCFNFWEEKMAELSPKHFHRCKPNFSEAVLYSCVWGTEDRFHTVKFQILLKKNYQNFSQKNSLEQSKNIALIILNKWDLCCALQDSRNKYW